MKWLMVRSAIVEENEYSKEIAEVMQQGFDQQRDVLEQLQGVIEEVLEYLNQ